MSTDIETSADHITTVSIANPQNVTVLQPLQVTPKLQVSFYTGMPGPQGPIGPSNPVGEIPDPGDLTLIFENKLI